MLPSIVFVLVLLLVLDIGIFEVIVSWIAKAAVD
jgi:hypothetical protein